MKKSIITIPLLLTATVSTIVFGQKYAAEQREQMSPGQVDYNRKTETGFNRVGSGDKKTSDEAAVVPSSSIEEYEERAGVLTLYEHLDYLSLLNGEARLAYYGDIDTEESWFNEMNDLIAAQLSGDLTILDFTYPDYDTYELYIQQTAQGVVSERPDLIIYGLSALPDKIRDMGLDETEQYMESIISSLAREDIPVILLEPYPVPGEINQFNSRSLDYRRYLERMQTVATAHSVPVLSLHAEFMARAEDEAIQSYYSENSRLNEKGTSYSVSILDDLFQETYEWTD